MKNRLLGIVIFSLLMASCVSIPKETVMLSKTIGADLQILRNSHRNIVQLYYSGIKANVNIFIDDIYSPFIINHVLESELGKYRRGETSLYGIIESAGKTNDKDESKEALSVMTEFQKAANEQISTKRNELLSPILSQERDILSVIDQYYQNIIYANATITAYLISTRNVKESQNEALSIIGLNGIDSTVTYKMVELSDFLDLAIEKGKNIDIKSDKAQQQIEDIVNKIEELTNKTTR